MSKNKTVDREILCPHCRYYGLPNVVKTMGGRRSELLCYRCGNTIKFHYTRQKAVKEYGPR